MLLHLIKASGSRNFCSEFYPKKIARPIDGTSAWSHRWAMAKRLADHRWANDGNATVYRWPMDGLPWDPNSGGTTKEFTK